MSNISRWTMITIGLAVAGAASPFIASPPGQEYRIDTIAGSGKPGDLPEDGGLAREVPIDLPFGVENGPGGALFVTSVGRHRVLRLDRKTGWLLSEGENNIIRAIDTVHGSIRTIAGAGRQRHVYAGDGILATDAPLWQPHGVCVGEDDSLVVSDTINHRVRLLVPIPNNVLIAPRGSVAEESRMAAQNNSQRSGRTGVVSHIKVISDKVEDVSSIEMWSKSFIKPGMTDEEKALAVWESVVRLRHQDVPPNEFLQSDLNVHDPIKTFNVYGYNMCCCAASNMEALARAVGLEARAWTIRGHNVAEIFYDGQWHMLDASLINYFRKPDGKIASVEEIIASVKSWFAEHPELKESDSKLSDFMRADGWTGWKRGPALFANSPFFGSDGWLPARTHGWNSTMQEYNGSTLFLYECGYSMGYELNIRLRPGERLIRNWSNKGLHVNRGSAPSCLYERVGEGNLSYMRQFGDLCPGRIGNGSHEYIVPLADSVFLSSALVAENLACKSEDGMNPPLHIKDGNQLGLLEIEMPSSYVYLSGQLAFHSIVDAGGQITALFSDNNSLDWKELKIVTASGEQTIDLTPLLMRRYQYRLRFVLQGAGTGLESLKITHDIQHSQRALPTLTQGKNTITFSAGPQEGTITFEGTTDPDHRDKQLVTTDFHPETTGVAQKLMHVTGPKGVCTFRISTPGDMVRLRLGCHYRARDAKDGWDIEVSLDDGKSFRTIDRLTGPTPGHCKYVPFSDFAPGTRDALVRWSGQQRNTTCLFSLRMDADYQQPAGGFRPVQVTYIWDEQGAEKRDVHIAAQPVEHYQITCERPPTMKSIVLQLAE